VAVMRAPVVLDGALRPCARGGHKCVRRRCLTSRRRRGGPCRRGRFRGETAGWPRLGGRTGRRLRSGYRQGPGTCGVAAGRRGQVDARDGQVGAGEQSTWLDSQWPATDFQVDENSAGRGASNSDSGGARRRRADQGRDSHAFGPSRDERVGGTRSATAFWHANQTINASHNSDE